MIVPPSTLRVGTDDEPRRPRDPRSVRVTVSDTVSQSRPRAAAMAAARLRRRFTPDVTATALMLGAVVVALIWANSPWHASYDDFWHSHIMLSLGSHEFDLSVQHW